MITRENMVIYINDHLTGLLESWGTVDGTHFRLFRKWTNLKGEEVEFIAPTSILFEAYNNHGTGKCPSWIELQDNYANGTLIERMFLKLIGQ